MRKRLNFPLMILFKIYEEFNALTSTDSASFPLHSHWKSLAARVPTLWDFPSIDAVFLNISSPSLLLPPLPTPSSQ